MCARVALVAIRALVWDECPIAPPPPVSEFSCVGMVGYFASLETSVEAYWLSSTRQLLFVGGGGMSRHFGRLLVLGIAGMPL